MDERGKSDEPNRSTWVGIVFGLWLAGVFAASLAGRMDATSANSVKLLILLTTALSWPVLYFTFGRCRFFPEWNGTGSVLALLTFLMFCLLSSFGSPRPLDSAGYSILTALTCWVVLQFTTNLDVSDYERGLKTYASVMFLLVGAFALYDYAPGVRLGNGKGVLNPNTVGLVALSPLVAAMAIRFLPYRWLIMGAMGVVVYLTGSRGAAVAAIGSVAMTMLIRLKIARARTLVLAFIVLVVGVGVAVPYYDKLATGFDQFFAFHDRYRGIETGGSGRFVTWQATWNLFLSSPILGVGFRAHEPLLKINSSAHNGYLALLTEIGMFGFAAAVFLTAVGLWRLGRHLKESSNVFLYSVLLGLACGYLLLAVVERYFINVGNPTSLLFLSCILIPKATERVGLSVRETKQDGAERPAVLGVAAAPHQPGMAKEQRAFPCLT